MTILDAMHDPALFGPWFRRGELDSTRTTAGVKGLANQWPTP
jgi:hypothetical protein